MTQFAYLFERFPSFGQTFCYREAAELARQGVAPPIFSIRNPKDESPQDWDVRIVQRVHYLPVEEQLLREIHRASKTGKLTTEIIGALDAWGRRTDFLRLYQAVYVGLRLQEMGIRHVHAHFAGMAARTAFWIHKFFPITFSFTAHANDIFAPRDFEIGLDKLVDAARIIVTVTDYAARFLRERFPNRADRIYRVYNGLNLSEFGRTDFSFTPPLIVAVGRLIAKKGFADLIRACGLLAEGGKPFQCEIVGEGPLENELRAQIEQLDLQNRVALSGAKPQREVRRRLAAASVFVLPSVVDSAGGIDNLPTVIMEAMATALPVISTDIGGIPEMVVENETGFLVRPGDTGALARAVEKMIDDRQLAQRLGRGGYERAQHLFSIEKNVRDLSALINAGGTG
ncbi:MAG TPA: glycosyltransferase family 4 protein [Candidatus Limnocylindria bacterium]|jgi:glycosyltransferase involved in cell wall biosynthesis|nr:glycosyltransferase family 4 protein [Candidatus Limnocylindria bacterium]